MIVTKNRGGRPRSKIPMKMVKIKGFDHKWVQEVALASDRSIHAVVTEIVAMARDVHSGSTINVPALESPKSQHESP